MKLIKVVRHTLDFKMKMSVVAGSHCIYIYIYIYTYIKVISDLTVWLLEWNPVVS